MLWLEQKNYSEIRFDKFVSRLNVFVAGGTGEECAKCEQLSPMNFVPFQRMTVHSSAHGC